MLFRSEMPEIAFAVAVTATLASGIGIVAAVAHVYLPENLTRLVVSLHNRLICSIWQAFLFYLVLCPVTSIHRTYQSS